MKKNMRIEALKYYAGFLTAAVALVIFTALMFTFTRKDLLEVLALYGMFIYVPAFFLPFAIAGEDPEDDYEDDDDY